jgi:pimeloyl-ACP methyl ester carboxylesterase
MAPILLIHGAWHGAWCWDRLIPALAARGRKSVAIDLPGGGGDPTPLAEVTLELYVKRVVETLERLDEPAILLGHSMGGLSITAAAEAAPERIAKLVYLCAFLPRDGDSMLGLARQSDLNEVAMKTIVSDDGLSITVVDETIKPAFYADCSDQDVAFAKARLRPLALQPGGVPVHITPERFGRVPRVYIECTEDRAIPIARQRAMAAASAPIEVHTLETSHSPFFSAPDALADLLAAL